VDRNINNRYYKVGEGKIRIDCRKIDDDQFELKVQNYGKKALGFSVNNGQQTIIEAESEANIILNQSDIFKVRNLLPRVSITIYSKPN